MTLTQTEIDALLTSEPASESSADAPAAIQTPDLFANASPEVKRILKLTVPVNVTLASRKINVSAILGWTVGSILEFDVSFDADLVLSISNHAIGTGQAVKVGENFGLRVSRIGSIHDRIDAMGDG
ncbi:MAG: FliM/FliN family flagellar motor switch protein [Planctomycetota bacterium]|jgi:flagellar motor switch protein FliN/FliY